MLKDTDLDVIITLNHIYGLITRFDSGGIEILSVTKYVSFSIHSFMFKLFLIFKFILIDDASAGTHKTVAKRLVYYLHAKPILIIAS